MKNIIASTRLLSLFLLLALAGAPGCDSSPKSGDPGKTKGAQKLGEPDATETATDGLLAKAGPVEVGLKDFAYAVRLNRLVAPMGQLEIPAEHLASRRLQIVIVEDLIKNEVIKHEFSKRGLSVSEADKAAALRTESGLAHYAPLLESGADVPDSASADASGGESGEKSVGELEEELKKRGLERADLEYVAGLLAREIQFRQVLLDGISQEAVWNYFAMKNDRARVLGVSMTNSPTMGELMNIVDTEPERIDAYFEENKLRWKKGDKKVELDDGLRRQIAGILLAQDSVIPSVHKKMMRIIQTLKDAKKLPPANESKAAKARRKRALDALTEKLQAQGGKVVVTQLFSRNAQGFIPEIGLSEPFARAIFATELDAPVSPQPVLSRQKAWAFLLLEREHPSREEFEGKKAQVRAEYRAKIEDVIIDRFVQNFFESHDPNLDLDPLSDVYPAEKPAAAGDQKADDKESTDKESTDKESTDKESTDNSPKKTDK